MISQLDENEWRFLHLDDDEAAHKRQIAGEIQKVLLLTNRAAILTMNGLISLENVPPFNEPKGLIFLLLAKVAQNIRFATIGLRLGYYTGACAVLRSAFEALTYVALFESNESEVAKWFRNEFSDKPQSERDSLHSTQRKAAKEALLNWENSRPVIKDAMYDFLRTANKRIHSSIRGLAEEFGMDIGNLVPDELDEILLKVEGDIGKALDTYALLSSFGKNIINKQDSDTEEKIAIQIHLFNQYHETTLADLAGFAFYIGHRLLDSASINFSIQDKEFNKGDRDWHRAIKDINLEELGGMFENE